MPVLKGNKVNNQDISVQVEITGSIAESIAALGKKMTKEVMVKAAKAGAEIVAQSIDSRIPVKTGELKDNLAVEITTNKDNVTATVGFADKFQASVAYWVEHGHASREARTLLQRFFRQKGTEKGSGHVPAHPFFRPGIDSAMKASSEAVMAELLKALQETEGKEKVA